MKREQKIILTMTIIAALLAIIVNSLLLPSVVIILDIENIDLNFTSSIYLMSYIGILIIFGMFAVGLTLIASEFKISQLLLIFGISFFTTMVCENLIAYYWIIANRSDLLVGLNLWQKYFLNLFRYNVVWTVETGNPQLVWILFDVILTILFNLKFYLLSRKQKQKRK